MKVLLIIGLVFFALLNLLNYFTQRTALEVRRFCDLSEEEVGFLYPVYFQLNIVTSMFYYVLLICCAIWINWIMAIIIGAGLLMFCSFFPIPTNFFLKLFRKKLKNDLKNGKVSGRDNLLVKLNEFSESLNSQNINSKCSADEQAEQYHHEGNLKVKAQDYRGAIVDYSKGIELCPRNAILYYYRGSAKFEVQDLTGSISDYSLAIEIDPEYKSAYHNRACVKFQIGDYQGVIEDSSMTLELCPYDKEALHTRGVAKLKLHDYIGAIQDLTSVIEIDDQDGWAFQHRGEAKIQLGQNVSGQYDINRARELTV